MSNLKLLKYSYRLTNRFLIPVAFFLLLTSCSKESLKINLKWNKSYTEDTVEKNIIGLKWCLSYLGSDIASVKDTTVIKFDGDTIRLDISKLKFGEKGKHHLQQLHQTLKQSEEYQNNNTVDIGRYISLTIGNSYHYYKITNVSEKLDNLESKYVFDSVQGYIDNSSVSLVDRIISFSKKDTSHTQAFISAEVDSITKEVFEFETAEIMPNGQLKFGIYDKNGALKNAASSEVTNAGKPSKCIWCHETVIQPIFSKQSDFKGYLSYKNLLDSLSIFNAELSLFQDNIWKDMDIRNKSLHTDMELVYISFMEPSAEHIAREWGIPLLQVKEKLSHLITHRHEEFDFLGDLYHRKDIDKLAPWKIIEVPESIREKSANKIDYLSHSMYFNSIENNMQQLNSTLVNREQSSSRN